MTVALVIDDAPDIRELIRHVLALVEVEMVGAESASDALVMLHEQDLPDIVVIDVEMPKMDGWAALDAIRMDPATSDLPVLLCTVNSSPADERRAWSLGADGFVVKPFEIDDLLDEIRGVLALSPRQRRALRERRRGRGSVIGA